MMRQQRLVALRASSHRNSFSCELERLIAKAKSRSCAAWERAYGYNGQIRKLCEYRVVLLFAVNVLWLRRNRLKAVHRERKQKISLWRSSCNSIYFDRIAVSLSLSLSACCRAEFKKPNWRSAFLLSRMSESSGKMLTSIGMFNWKLATTRPALRSVDLGWWTSALSQQDRNWWIQNFEKKKSPRKNHRRQTAARVLIMTQIF